MTIDEVYKLTQAFASKDQRGFITPSEFNLMAQQAELELYNERLQVVMEKSQPRKAAGYYTHSLTPDLAEQDILPFLYSVFKNTSQGGNFFNGAFTTVDADYICQIYASSSKDSSMSANVPVDIVTPKNVGQVLRSNLVKPSMGFPVALLSSNDTSTSIEIFPKELVSVDIHYYSYNNKPLWSYVTIAGKPVYDASNSRGFQVSSRCHGELVIKILGYLGVSIREVDLINYAQAKEVEQDKE